MKCLLSCSLLNYWVAWVLGSIGVSSLYLWLLHLIKNIIGGSGDSLTFYLFKMSLVVTVCLAMENSRPQLVGMHSNWVAIIEYRIVTVLSIENRDPRDDLPVDTKLLALKWRNMHTYKLHVVVVVYIWCMWRHLSARGFVLTGKSSRHETTMLCYVNQW